MGQARKMPGRSGPQYIVSGCLSIFSGMLLFLLGVFLFILTPAHNGIYNLPFRLQNTVFILFCCWMGISLLLSWSARDIMFSVSFLGLVADLLTCMATAAVVSSSIRKIITAPGGNAFSEITLCLFSVAASGVIAVTVIYMSLLVLFPRNHLAVAHHGGMKPEPCWGEAIPLPLVAVAIILQVTAMLLGFRLLHAWHVHIGPLFPVPGSYIVGSPAQLAILLMIAVVLLLAVGVLKQHKTAWWGLLATFFLGSVYGFFTFRNMDPVEKYRVIGLPGTQMHVTQQPSLFFSTMHGLICFGFIFAATFLLLLWLRRFFRKDIPGSVT